MTTYKKEWDCIVEAIETPIAVCEAVVLKQGMKTPKVFKSECFLWDTGSTSTLISSKVVSELGLKPYGRCLVSDNSTVDERDTYLIHVGLPTGNTAINVEAMLTLSEDYDVIIGMDIIASGNFKLTNENGKSVFSFS